MGGTYFVTYGTYFIAKKLANPGTPIHTWSLPDVPPGLVVSIKRDDMTGCTLSGNKVHKLEFLMADALAKKCGHVITCSTLQSNHCRAVVVAARQLGIRPHVFLMTDIQDVSEVGCEGNLLLNRLCGAEMYLVPADSPFDKMNEWMKTLANKLKQETGEDSYVIGLTDTDVIGLHGYITNFEEMISQGVLEQFDDIVFACASGATAAGLGISNYLTGSRVRCHAVLACQDHACITDYINKTLCEVGLDSVRCSDIVDLVDGYIAPVSGQSSPEDLDFISKVSEQTGILLDPVYSGKAAIGLVKELKDNPGRFKGNRILFIHTGGVFTLYDGRMDTFVKEKTKSSVHMWSSMDGSPEDSTERCGY